MKTSAKFLVGMVAAWLFCAASLQAGQVTVQELPFDSTVQIADVSIPYLSYTGGVYAGVNHLLVAGTPMNGFCIDPFHFSSTSPLLYDVVSLDHAPKAPGMMNATQAGEISQLWSEYYSPAMSSTNAAGMQIAIWEIVAGGGMTVLGSDFGAKGMLDNLTAYTGPAADLVGLTGSGQDYVVQRSPIVTPAGASQPVPDQGSTFALLGLTTLGLLAAGATQGKFARPVSGV